MSESLRMKIILTHLFYFIKLEFYPNLSKSDSLANGPEVLKLCLDVYKKSKITVDFASESAAGLILETMGTIILFENIDLISFWELLCENYSILSDLRPRVICGILEIVSLAVEFEPEKEEAGSPYSQRYKKFLNDLLIYIWTSDIQYAF